MKKSLFIIGVLFLAVGCAPSTQFTKLSPPGQPIPEESAKARVYVIRPTLIGSAVTMKIYENGKQIGKLGAKSYLAWDVDADKDTVYIISMAENKDILKLNPQPGESYFIKQNIQMGVVVARSNIELIDETEGRELLKKTKAPKIDLQTKTLDTSIVDKALVENSWRKNAISIDVTPLIYADGVGFTYERALSKNFSLGANFLTMVYAASTETRGGIVLSEYKLSGPSLILEGRYYPFVKKKKAPHGFFTGLYYKQLFLKESYDSGNASVMAGGAGLQIGYKFGGKLFFEPLFGMGYGWYDENEWRENPLMETLFLRAELKLGLNF